MRTACCPWCGAEYAESEGQCWDCKLVVPQPVVPTLLIGDVGTDDELAYELDDWPIDDRVDAARRLGEAGVPFRWEPGPALVVRQVDEPAVEQVLDDIETSGPSDEQVDADAAEADAQEAMSDLFVAADRLGRDPTDVRAAGDLVEAADTVAGGVVPYGIEPVAWAQVQEMAASVREELASGADDDVVAADAQALRALLRRFV